MLPLGRVAVGLPLHLLLPLIVANTDVTSTDASSVLGATLNMILTRPQAPLTADSATGPAHGSRLSGCTTATGPVDSATGPADLPQI